VSDFVIHVENEFGVGNSIRQKIEAAARRTLELQGVRKASEMSLLLTGSERIRALNRDFRHRDETTDVLSFADEGSYPGAEDYLGDVAIAIPVAATQAANAGHSLEAETVLLTVHGVLHLLGYDHADAAGRREMWQAQELIIRDLGYETPMPDQTESA
jgi:probable rRNA maturation factor